MQRLYNPLANPRTDDLLPADDLVLADARPDDLLIAYALLSADSLPPADTRADAYSDDLLPADAPADVCAVRVRTADRCSG